MRTLFTNEDGAIAAYVAIFAALALASGALAIDFGRMTVLRTQMQNRADAAALAGAVQLDARDGARTRARDVATNAARTWSAIPGDKAELAVAAVNFYSELEPDPVAANSDLEAQYIEVVLEPRVVDFFFEPLMALFSGQAAAGSTTLEASAVAKPSPFICEAPPLMVCDLAEEDPSMDFALTGNIGRQLRLKEPQAGGTPWAPGNFGLLSLPDGSSGAADIEGALAAVEPEECYSLDVTTAEGSKTNKVKDGINARFDLPGGLPYPAPDVINYPRDQALVNDPDAKMGDGDWGPEVYWPELHEGAPLPPDLAGASRYQTYLYELGLEYAHNGHETMYPVEAPLAAGFTVVTPPGANVPQTSDPLGDDDGDTLLNEHDPDQDGVPSQTVASNGYERRIMKVAVLRCVEDNIHGLGTYPTHGNFIDVFVTEQVQDPSQAGIYAEIVRPLSQTDEPDFHANVRLVR
ncbi:MAG: pilus assembly protein TadG-related protein [Alphaproteobacteria bacterium]